MRRLDWMVCIGLIIVLASVSHADLYRQAKAPLGIGKISIPSSLDKDVRGGSAPGAPDQTSASAPQDTPQSPNDPPDDARVYLLGQNIGYPSNAQGSPLCWHNTRKVASGSDEFFVAGWETGNESDNEVMVTSWDVFFGLWSNPVPVSESAADAGRIDFCEDLNGTIHAVWHQDHDLGGNAYEVFYAKLPAGEFAWTDPVMVSTLDATESNFPTCHVDNMGNVTVRWSEFLRNASGGITSYFGYRVITSTDFGETWDPANMTWATQDTLLVWGSGCADPVSGDVYLVDYNADSDGGDEYSDLVVYFYDKSADTWMDAEIVEYGGNIEDPYRDITHASCAVGPDGVCHILYAQTTNADPGFIWIDQQVSAPVAAPLFHVYGTYGDWSEPEMIYPGTDGIYENVDGVYPDSTFLQLCSYAQIGVDQDNRLYVSTRAYEYYNGQWLTGYGDMYSDIGGSNFQPEAFIGCLDQERDGEWVWTRASDVNLRPDSIGVKMTKLVEHVPASGPAVVWDETYDGLAPSRVLFTRLVDFTSPGPVSNIVAQRPEENGPITLTWENPEDEDLSGIRIIRTTYGMAHLVGLRRGSVPMDMDGQFLYPTEDIWIVVPDSVTGEWDLTFVDEEAPAGDVYYTLIPFDENLHHTYPLDDASYIMVGPQVSGDTAQPMPTGLYLAPTSPSPVVTTAEISYNLPSDGNVRLAIYDLSGRCVKTLMDGPKSAGAGTLHWDARNDEGSSVSNGVYLCRIEHAGQTATRNLVVLR